MRIPSKCRVGHQQVAVDQKHQRARLLFSESEPLSRILAEDTAALLGFDERDTRTLVMLVHRHLLMAHTAFRRDPYDEKVLLPFAREVGTPEVLRKLLALTAADIAAVGPDVLTKWKESLLIELYLRAMQEVSGERETVDEPQRLALVVADVASQQASDPDIQLTEYGSI